MLNVIEIKGLRRAAGIAKVHAGTKDCAISFHRNTFANAQGLTQFLQASRGKAKVQPDHKVVFKGDWDHPQVRFKGVRALVYSVADIDRPRPRRLRREGSRGVR